MVDFSMIKTYSIKERKNLVTLGDFAKPDNPIIPINNQDIQEISNQILQAKQNTHQVILMCGAHIIKTGQSPYIIELMKKGLITHIAVNGAFSIHDFEIALIGETSEDVVDGLKNGTFGMVEETGKFMNTALIQYKNIGYGKAIGKKIDELNPPYKEHSVLWHAYKLSIPLTVHVAIGTDIIHQHPQCDGAALGKATYNDFQIFTNSVSKLKNGICLNIGSAVILPEVFLKALTISQNLNSDITNITTANFDQIDHYRPRVNVVQRPTQSLGGKGYMVIAKHQESIPTLHYYITQKLKEVQQ